MPSVNFFMSPSFLAAHLGAYGGVDDEAEVERRVVHQGLHSPDVLGTRARQNSGVSCLSLGIMSNTRWCSIIPPLLYPALTV